MDFLKEEKQRPTMYSTVKTQISDKNLQPLSSNNLSMLNSFGNKVEKSLIILY